jgi:hypothetical protein
MDRVSQPIDDSRVNLCTVCGVVASRAGSRCTVHPRQSNHSRHNALYSTPRFGWLRPDQSGEDWPN